MRQNRPTRRSRRQAFARLWSRPSGSLRRAPRRRDVERLEERQVMSADVAANIYFAQQWNLDANGQQTEFDPTSPTRLQTLATTDINVIEAWEQLATGLGVQIGIISGGFDLTHEDLQPAVPAGGNSAVGGFIAALARDVLGGAADTNAGFVDPTDANGTAVAGIIGARNNNLGIVGIAYNADLVPIRAIPGAFDTEVRTDATDAQAIRFRAGILGDSDGNGVLDNVDQLVDTDGDGKVDSFPATQVIDVYFISGAFNSDVIGAQADPLSDPVLTAIRDGANSGRSRWVDSNNDGLFQVNEVRSLGAIYVVPAGDDNGTTFDVAFDDQGNYESSQYNALANSRYTIAVGAVPYSGRYEDVAVGTVTSFSEMGTHVLIVAPSSTNEVDIAGEGDGDLNSGLLTTDLTGDNGRNQPPTDFPIVDEFDRDFFPDTDYTSTFGGTEAAAAQVTAVIAQMLQVNPNLSRRDVEQILLASARTNDQFSETWVTNAFTYFQDPFTFNPLVDDLAAGVFNQVYQAPIYAYYDLDTNADGDADVEDAVLPNTPLLSDVFDPNIVRSYFLNNADLTIPTLGFTNVTGLATVLASSATPPEDLFIFSDVGGNLRPGVNDLQAPASYTEVPLRFENGAGYTVSHGYGQYLEEIGYAHGLLDAGLAVTLARAWNTYDLFKDDSVTISTAVADPNTLLVVQPAGIVGLQDGIDDLVIPGGINAGVINVGFYEEFNTPFTSTDVNDAGGNRIGEVITGGPFYDPDGNQTFTNTRGSSFFPIQIDQSTLEDFISIEWIEVRSAIAAGDIDHVRLSILSPDGTQSELNPFRQDAALPDDVTFQFGQFSQGLPVPAANEGDGPVREILDDRLGSGSTSTVHNSQLTGFNDGSENQFIADVALADALPAGTPWTWTTNRHYGELFSVEASNLDNPAAGVDGQWYLVLENYGGGAVSFDGLQITVHGTRATGQRIQGKIGVDDNAQNIDFFNVPTQPGGSTALNPTPQQLGDGIFNFDRFVEFGELVIDPTPVFDANGFYVLTGDETNQVVVLDDGTDGIYFDEFGDRTYRTIDPDTGIESFFPVVSREAYFAYDTDPNAASELVSNLQEFDAARFTNVFVNPSLRKTDGQFVGSAGGFVLVDTDNDPLTPGVFGTLFSDGSIGSYQNFDYSQESFAAGVLVEAVQYRVVYDQFGQAASRVATNQVQRFVTGADGNYWFDVEATVAPPDILDDPQGYADWFEDNGQTFEYEIRVVGESDRLFDREFHSRVQENPAASQIAYTGGGVYDVQIFADPDVKSGQTVKVRDLNFLLAVDLAEVQVNVTGSVIRDLDGDAAIDATDGRYAGITVFHDANNNNARDAGEASAVSAADGSYTLSFNPDGATSASVRLDPTTYPAADPLRPVSPVDANGAAEITLTGLEPGDTLTQNFFLRPTAGSATGTVFTDIDADGVIDAGEAVFNGTTLGVDNVNPAVFVYIDANGSGTFNTGETRSAVSASGAYQFEFQVAQTAVIRLDTTNADVSQVFPAGGGARVATLVTNPLGDIVPVQGLNFGVQDLRVFDFGDLPGSYGTTLSGNGARHRVNDGALRLGSAAPDLEFDGQASVNADGDDALAADDEDGVVLVGATIDPATGVVTSLTLQVTVSGGGGLFNAFIDFNGNGIFDGNEQVRKNVGNLATATPNTIVVTAPAGTVALDRYAARFRYGPNLVDEVGVAGQRLAASVGPANAGEVEDHWLIPTPVTVSGRVLFDTNNNGVFNGGTDAAVANARVFIDENLNGVRDTNEPSAITGADGSYTIQTTAPAAGQIVPITIRVVAATLPTGTQFLSPIDGIVSELVSRNPGAEPNNTVTANFLTANVNRPTQSISGRLLADANEVAGVSGSEAGLAGVTVRVLTNLDADPELEVLATTTTDATGAYRFDLANTGTYQVEVVLAAGTDLVLTTPNPAGAGGGRISETISIDEDAVLAPFGVFDRRSTFTRDFGDLPAGYNTNGAPSHLVVTGANPVRLGATVDTDGGALPSAAANGDDLNFSDDEDGVTLASVEAPTVGPGGVVTAPGTIEIDVTATGRLDSRLNVWYDLDGSGVFESDEHLVVDLDIPDGGETTRVVRTTVDPALVGRTSLAVRVRYGTPGVGPVGSAGAGGADAIGEVEDHLFMLQPPAIALALATATEGGEGAVAESAPASVTEAATLFIPPRLAEVLDETHAVESSPSAPAADAIDGALLEWSLGSYDRDSEESVETATADGSEESVESEDLALAEAFA